MLTYKIHFFFFRRSHDEMIQWRARARAATTFSRIAFGSSCDGNHCDSQKYRMEKLYAIHQHHHESLIEINITRVDGNLQDNFTNCFCIHSFKNRHKNAPQTIIKSGKCWKSEMPNVHFFLAFYNSHWAFHFFYTRIFFLLQLKICKVLNRHSMDIHWHQIPCVHFTPLTIPKGWRVEKKKRTQTKTSNTWENFHSHFIFPINFITHMNHWIGFLFCGKYR